MPVIAPALALPLPTSSVGGSRSNDVAPAGGGAGAPSTFDDLVSLQADSKDDAAPAVGADPLPPGVDLGAPILCQQPPLLDLVCARAPTSSADEASDLAGGLRSAAASPKAAPSLGGPGMQAGGSPTLGDGGMLSTEDPAVNETDAGSAVVLPPVADNATAAASDKVTAPTAALMSEAVKSAPVPTAAPPSRANAPTKSDRSQRNSADWEASSAAPVGQMPAPGPSGKAENPLPVAPPLLFAEPESEAAPIGPKAADPSSPGAPRSEAAVPNTPAETASAPPAAARASAETTAALAAQIVRKLEARTTRFDVALTPEGLGRVDVTVRIAADGAISAAFAFEQPQSAAEVGARSSELRQSLQQAGFDLAGDAFSFTEQDGRQPGSSSYRDPDARPAYDFADLMNGELDAAFPTPSSLSVTRSLRLGLDVRV